MSDTTACQRMVIATPTDDLCALIELGYASKSRDVREAAGRIDTWLSKPFDLHMMKQFGPDDPATERRKVQRPAITWILEGSGHA
jgi:hypothetical protein